MEYRRKFELICFDVDGTLVHHPEGLVIWEVLNLRFGGDRETNRERFESFRRGEITYDEWVELDVSGWRRAGATHGDIVASARSFSLIDGARETIHELKRRGFRLAVISGTLDVVLDTLFPDHPFDDVYTNRLVCDDDGKVVSCRATRYDGVGKPRALEKISRRHAIPLDRSAFVGDGENDVPLIGVPGYFVAFEPKCAELEQGADLVIRGGGLRLLLDVFR